VPRTTEPSRSIAERNTMNRTNRNRKRNAFQPTLADAALEQRLEMSGAAGEPVAASAIPTMPAPAPAPVSVAIVTRAQGAHLRAELVKEYQHDGKDLRKALDTDVRQLSVNHDPTPVQVSDVASSVAGAVDATALVMANQATVLGQATTGLFSMIQNSLLSPSPFGTINRLDSFIYTARDGATSSSSPGALSFVTNLVATQAVKQVTTAVSSTSATATATNFYESTIGPDFALSTANFSNPFASQTALIGSTTGSGFNNLGFLTGTGNLLLGFGSSPTTTNTNFNAGLPGIVTGIVIT
jgi:hypothetical protein